MKIEELQKVNQEELSKRVGSYWIWEAVCVAGSVLVSILFFRFLFYLNYLDEMFLIPPFFWILGMLFSLIGALGMILIFLIISRRNAIKIIEIQEEECDPFLYEACWRKTQVRFLYKNNYLCNLMLAQYYQGNYEEAWNTAEQIERQKLKGVFRVNFYIIMSALCFEKGIGAQVKELEEEFRLRISTAGDKKNMQFLCANNNHRRAYENKDYTAAYGFLQEIGYLTGSRNTRKLRVLNSFLEARLALACGKLEEAKVKAGFAARYGNRTAMAKEAEDMLEEIAAKEHKAGMGGNGGMDVEEVSDESR